MATITRAYRIPVAITKAGQEGTCARNTANADHCRGPLGQGQPYGAACWVSHLILPVSQKTPTALASKRLNALPKDRDKSWGWGASTPHQPVGTAPHGLRRQRGQMPPGGSSIHAKWRGACRTEGLPAAASVWWKAPGRSDHEQQAGTAQKESDKRSVMVSS